MIAADRSEEQVLQAVVVVVANRHAHAVAAQLEPGAGGDIGEVALAVIVIQSGGRVFFACGNMPGPIGGIDKEQVGGAVVVEIEEGNPAAHRLRQQLVAVSAVVVDKGNACLFGDVGESGNGNSVERQLTRRRRVQFADLRLRGGLFAFQEKGGAGDDSADKQQYHQRPAKRAANDGVIVRGQFVVFPVRWFIAHGT